MCQFIFALAEEGTFLLVVPHGALALGLDVLGGRYFGINTAGAIPVKASFGRGQPGNKELNTLAVVVKLAFGGVLEAA